MLQSLLLSFWENTDFSGTPSYQSEKPNFQLVAENFVERHVAAENAVEGNFGYYLCWPIQHVTRT